MGLETELVVDVEIDFGIGVDIPRGVEVVPLVFNFNHVPGMAVSFDNLSIFKFVSININALDTEEIA